MNIQLHKVYKWCEKSEKLERDHANMVEYIPRQSFQTMTHKQIHEFMLANTNAVK